MPSADFLGHETLAVLAGAFACEHYRSSPLDQARIFAHSPLLEPIDGGGLQKLSGVEVSVSSRDPCVALLDEPRRKRKFQQTTDFPVAIPFYPILPVRDLEKSHLLNLA